MSISDYLSRCTVRLECGNGERRSIGTSFLYRLEAGDNWIPLLITNRHVVDGHDRAHLRFSTAFDLSEATLEDARSFVINDFQDFVIYHPNAEIDLAAILIGPLTHGLPNGSKPIFLNAVSETDLADGDIEQAIRYVEDILVVGYPNGLWDEHRNIPIFRKGVTATPAMIDYQNEPKFLIDCSIFPGSSGSPVFLYNSGVIFDKRRPDIQLGERVRLLGVVFAVMQHQADGFVIEQPVPALIGNRVVIGMPNNLGVVVKARENRILCDAVRQRADMISTAKTDVIARDFT